MRDESGRTTIFFELEDRWTLNPLLSFGTGGGAFFFRAGATDANIGGRFLEAYGLYENFDGFHGGLLMVRNPRVLGSRLDIALQGDRLVRPRSGFADQRTSGAIEVAQLFSRDRMRLGLRTSVFANRFLAPLETPPHFPFPTETLFFEPRFRVGRVDTVRVRQTGATIELKPGLGFTSSDVASEYVSMAGEVLAFAMPGERWNFALRARAGTISRVPAHLELYAGGLDLVRGFPDNFVRTRSLALFNLEARLVAFDSTWVAIIPAVFVDGAAARSPQGDVGTALSTGGGVRLVIPKWVASGIRIDLAVPLHSNMRRVEESERRFGPVTPPPSLGSVQPSVGVFQFF